MERHEVVFLKCGALTRGAASLGVRKELWEEKQEGVKSFQTNKTLSRTLRVCLCVRECHRRILETTRGTQYIYCMPAFPFNSYSS